MHHASDGVFDRLASAIFRGDHPVASSLPSERTLSESFRVSRAVIRQAVHRLAEHGLVHLKPGGATIVLDSEKATDIRVIGLLYRLGLPGRPDARVVRDVREKQFLQGLAIIDVASRRARPEQLEHVADLVEAWARTEDPRAAFDQFEESFWRALVGAAGNRIYQLEIAWWYQLLADHPALRYAPSTPMGILVAFYRELARRLTERDQPVAYYHQAVAPLLASL